MNRLKICETRLEAETIIHALNKVKIVALVKAYQGIETHLKDKLEIMVNPNDLEKAEQIIKEL